MGVSSSKSCGAEIPFAAKLSLSFRSDTPGPSDPRAPTVTSREGPVIPESLEKQTLTPGRLPRTNAAATLRPSAFHSGSSPRNREVRGSRKGMVPRLPG